MMGSSVRFRASAPVSSPHLARHRPNAFGSLRPCPVGPCGYRIRPIRAGERRAARQAQERHRADEPVFLFLATYHTDADAQLDYAGGVIGHFWNGMSRKDVMELGEMLDDGTVALLILSLIHISEPTRRTPISYAVFCLKKKKKIYKSKKK